MAFGSATTGTEEGRIFFQERLRLYTGWVFVFAFGFYLLNLALYIPSAGLAPLLMPSQLWHLAGALAAALVWLITRTGPLSWPRLLWIDGAGLSVICFCFAMMGGSMSLFYLGLGIDPSGPVLVAQLACTSTVLTRAVAVPSTPTRTFWVVLAALAPQMAVATYFYVEGGTLGVSNRQPFGTDIGGLLNVLGWSGVAVAVATVGARVIFGLRTEADKIKRLGQYVLEEKIGEGGMGIVYRASHAMLRRPTAVKLLPPEKTGEDTIRRFEREVQFTSRLSHPCTVAIFDYGRTPDGVFYYAMEYLDGVNLEDLVRIEGPQPAARVIHILQQVCGALTEAHEVGLIHRDIKPANVILCERGGIPDVAKVVDFGLVKAIAATDADATVLATVQHALTGTPMYMAPEAIKGDQGVDGRSDLYALGAVGYFLITGAPVFEAQNIMEIVGHHLHTEPPPLADRSDATVLPEFEAVVMRCLAKNPDDRFPTARALAQALAACATRCPWSLEQAGSSWEILHKTREDDRIRLARNE
jgi:serine/threonine-protein kinase